MTAQNTLPGDVEGNAGLDRLRLGTGFSMSEREGIVSHFVSLGNRLRSVDSDSVDMELSVKERAGADQRVTLQLWIAGHDRLVATSARTDLDGALQEVRDDMVRLLNDQMTRSARSHNRSSR